LSEKHLSKARLDQEMRQADDNHKQTSPSVSVEIQKEQISKKNMSLVCLPWCNVHIGLSAPVALAGAGLLHLATKK
jgi:hypothetical protein